MSFLYKLVVNRQPERATEWLTTEQQEDFETNYFDSEESAFFQLIKLIRENGLASDPANNPKDLSAPSAVDLVEVEFNPMVEALKNLNNLTQEDCEWARKECDRIQAEDQARRAKYRRRRS